MAKLTVADVPHMLKMWDRERNKEKPEDVPANHKYPKHWKCPDCGYAWSVSPKTRYKGSGKCPCHETNKVICKGINDVLSIVKGLVAFIDEDNDFEELYKQGVDSKMPVNFKCDECGRKWNASLKSQIKKDENGGYIVKGCHHYNIVKRKKEKVPFCSEVESLSRFWDPNNPMDPNTTRSNSTDPAHFSCKNCGYDWTKRIYDQTRGSGKCKCCELLLVIRKGFSDVFTSVPEAELFYNFDKNKDVDIYSLPLRDNKKQIDWKCPKCNREWQSTLSDRIKGKKGNYSFIGCRDCIKRATITPVASIPELMRFWDFKKNRARGLDPNLTSAHANVPADWYCKECGYEWDSHIKTRKNSDGKCPHCKGSPGAVVTGVDDILTLCPELETIYDFDYNKKKGIDIYKEGPGSKKEAHFYCKKCGNEWDSRIRDRVRKNDDGVFQLADCPKCSHKLLRKVPYSVEFPLLAKMYREDLNKVPLDSIRGAEGINKTYYWWECPECGEIFDSTLNSMIMSYKYSTHGCPFCSHTRLRKGESFADLHPELMDEYDPANKIDPYNTFPNCKDDAGWICRDCGHHWIASFTLRHKGGGNCPVCNRTALIPDINSFAAVYPDLVKYWADSNERRADELFYNSSLWLKFICPVCGREHGAYIEDFVAGESCPFCKGIILSPEINSLKATHPDVARRWSPNNEFEPDTVFATSWKGAKWICDECSCEYPARVKSVVNGEDECPYCAGKLAIPGKTSLKALYPDIAKLLSPNDRHDPDLMLPDSKSPYIWRCPEYDLDYIATTYEMINGYTCPYCDGRKAVPGKTSLEALYPDIAKLLSPNDGHDPDLMLPDATTPHIWRCPDCNYDYNATTYEMINGYTCPYCNDRIVMPGFNSFGDKHPELVAEMDKVANYLLPKTPYEVLDTSNNKFWFDCQNDRRHKYPMSPCKRLMFEKRHREPCPYCRGQRRKLHRFVSYNKTKKP